MLLQRFTYTDDASAAVDLTLGWAGRAWTPASEAVGGREFSANRAAVASYEIRRDQILGQTLRVRESEWPAVRKMLEHGQRGTVITVFPDSTGVGRTAYLLTPGYDERIMPRRGDFPGLLEIDVEWLDTSGSGWDAFAFYDE